MNPLSQWLIIFTASGVIAAGYWTIRKARKLKEENDSLFK